MENYELEHQSVSWPKKKKTKFCTPGTQSVRNPQFKGVPADAEKRVRQTPRKMYVNCKA